MKLPVHVEERGTYRIVDENDDFIASGITDERDAVRICDLLNAGEAKPSGQTITLHCNGDEIGIWQGQLPGLGHVVQWECIDYRVVDIVHCISEIWIGLTKIGNSLDAPRFLEVKNDA
jgi:hypothetical protein